MSIGTASILDTAKFRKVHGLMTGGATEGERAAARARADAMARNAGLTLDQAVSSLDARPQAPSADFFAGFDDWMEERYPGHKAEQAQRKSDRSDRDAARRSAILAEFGTEQAFFAPTPEESALFAAIEPFVTGWHRWTDEWGVEQRTASEIDGRSLKGALWSPDDLTERAREAIREALPWPSTLDAALREVRAWDQLRFDRAVFWREWDHAPEVECRVRMLERALDGEQRAATWDDLQARFDWKRWEWERQWLDPQERNDPFLDCLEADFATLRTKEQDSANEASPARYRNTGEKRAAVLSMLDAHPELSDREIARRIGVSPQTVNTWRKKHLRPQRGT